jgi:1-deoxy-D-xylulose-5-phosphate synthase
VIIDTISSPADLRALSVEECYALAAELRAFIVESVTKTGGHLGSNLGSVELTIALHRVFSSPDDAILFDTGHQAYVHKLLTGRKAGFARLKKAGGLSGYPNRRESDHDIIENSHASTALSWAHGIAEARRQKGEDKGRHVVAVVGDGALTGGMAYEALNNLGHSSSRVVIVLNDNGRSYAPTVSKLSGSLTQLRLDPRYMKIREALKGVIEDVPVMGPLAEHSFRGITSALREAVEPHVFFEALGVRYTGPLDGHDIAQMEHALSRAASWDGPIVLHLLTTKGKGYGPAENDEVACLHDFKAAPIAPGDEGGLKPAGQAAGGESYTEAFTKALLQEAENDESIVAITAAMPGPTGLLPFEKAFPERFFDVGIAEQHAMTAAAGMAFGGLHPVVCIYSTFLQRCVDQWNLDVALHEAPVVVVADRAGITGDDGPSHHGIYDMHSALSIPGVNVYAPSEPAEVAPLLHLAVASNAPSLLRYPKTPSAGPLGPVGVGDRPRVLRKGRDDILFIGVGKLAKAACDAAELLARQGIEATVIDPRVIRPVHPELVSAMLGAHLVVTAEDGIVIGGAGQYLALSAEQAASDEEAVLPDFVHLGVPTAHLAHGAPDGILSSLGLDGPGIAASALQVAERLGLVAAGASPAPGEQEAYRADPAGSYARRQR